MSFTVTLPELKSGTPRNLPIELKLMGDSSAPVRAGNIIKIKPSNGKNFKPFDKFEIGGRCKTGHYVMVTLAGKNMTTKKKKLENGKTVCLEKYKVRSELEKYNSTSLSFSIDASDATIKIIEDMEVPPWKPYYNLAGQMSVVRTRRIDLAGIVVSASDPRDFTKEVNGEKHESQVADVTLMDSSQHSAAVTLWGELASNVPAVGTVIALTNLQIKVAEDKITGVWSTEYSECEVINLKIDMPADAKSGVHLVEPRALGKNISKETVPQVTCAQTHWLLDNKMESTEVLEIPGVYLSNINDPLETAMCERKKSEEKEEVLKVTMQLSDRSGSCQVAAFERTVLEMYSVLQKQPYGLQEVREAIKKRMVTSISV